MPSRLLSLIAMFCLASMLHAQVETPAGSQLSPARFQLYGGYSFLSNSLNGVTGSHQPMNGWDASLCFPSWRNLRFKLDFSGYSGTNLGAPEKPYFIMGGAQYSKRLGRETVYVEGMGGDGGVGRYWGANKTTGETASFVGFVGGGADTRISRRLAFRVDGGLQYSYFALASGKGLIPYRIPGLPTNFGRVSSGLVWNF